MNLDEIQFLILANKIYLYMDKKFEDLQMANI